MGLPLWVIRGSPGGWNTGLMGRTGQRLWWAPARGVLLVAVLAGLFGMHVLTAADAVDGHGAIPMIGAADHGGSAGHDSSVVAAGMGQSDSSDDVAAPPETGPVVGSADPGSGIGHGAMAGCILFLVLGGAALLLALLRYRGPFAVAGSGRLTAARLVDLRRRGPPIGWPRVSLSVIRV